VHAPFGPPAVTRAQLIELSAGVILLGGAVGAAAYWSRGATVGRAGEFPVSRPAEPTAALDLELLDLTGQPVRLHNLRGRVVLLNFWATWCAPCREEMPALETLAREFGPRGLAVVGVNFKEPKPQVQAFMRDNGLGFPTLLDVEGEVAKRYQVFALPVTFVVDRRGMLAGSVLGIRDWTGPGARAYFGRLLDMPEA
jgi:thiol-disulfide isomerase/thioredoxin